MKNLFMGRVCGGQWIRVCGMAEAGKAAATYESRARQKARAGAGRLQAEGGPRAEEAEAMESQRREQGGVHVTA